MDIIQQKVDYKGEKGGISKFKNKIFKFVFDLNLIIIILCQINFLGKMLKISLFIVKYV